MGIADEIRKELDDITQQSAERLGRKISDEVPAREETIATLTEQIAALSNCLVKVAAVTDRLWEVNQKLISSLNGLKQ